MKKLLFYIFFSLLLSNGFCQSTNLEIINSIDMDIKKATQDTTKARLYCLLSMKYRSFDIEKANISANKALNYAKASGNKTYIAKAITTNAMNVIYQGNYDEGILYLERGLEILNPDTITFSNNSIEINKELGIIYNGIGTAYDFKSNYILSITYYLKATSVFQEINNIQGLGVAYNNLGISYLYIQDLNESEKYFQKSFNLYLQLKDTATAYQANMNLAIIDYYKGDVESAIKSFKECEIVMKRIGNLRSRGHCLTNIGQMYKELEVYDSSLFYINKGVEVDLILEDREGLSEDYIIIGGLYLKMKQHNNARKYYLQALEIALDLRRKIAIRNIYGKLFDIELELGNYKSALSYQVLTTTYHDSIRIESNTKEIGKIEAENEFNKEIEIQKIENDKKFELEKGKRKQQSIVLYFIIGLFVVISFFVYMLYKSLRLTKEQKELVYEAKLEIEEKNRELVDSIKYAKRIQLALLKEDGENFKDLPNHFILFQPKDIVSGDFYWTYRIKNYWYIAAVDCTGHGVPGALLTMLGTAYLNEICAGNNVLTPAKILDELKYKITKELSQTGEQGESKDGMDMSLIRYDLDTKEVLWAGANNSIYYINKEALQEIKPDKQPIGYSDNPKPYTNHKVPVNLGDSLYLFSDGYADQFGGEKGKKFKYSNFKKILLKTNIESPETQKEILLKTFKDWQGELEQLDDVCIIGIRL